MACYDIANPKRLRRAAKILEQFGIRIQKSFFQCEMEKNMIDEVIRKLLKVINIRKDALFIYPLCKECTGKVITDGTGKLINLESFEIL